MEERFEVIAGSIDSHAHLAMMAEREIEPETLLARLRDEGFVRLIDVGTRPSDLHPREAAWGEDPLVELTSGLHPTSVDEGWASELALLEAQLDTGSIVAVGEIGLDYYHSTEFKKEQLAALETQLELAARHDKAVILHNRASESDMLGILEKRRPRGVLHCFSQDASYCRSALTLGLHISFGGNLTYRRSDDIREAARLVPDDRLLVETDSPFLSPQAVRGRTNHPGHLFLTIEALAELRGQSPQQVAHLTARNTARLFGLSIE